MSVHDIELLEPMPKEYVYTTIPVTQWSRPHRETVGYVGHWISEEENEVRVYVMRGIHLLEYISDLRPSNQKVIE